MEGPPTDRMKQWLRPGYILVQDPYQKFFATNHTLFPGITTVEWPTVLNDLKIRYGGLAYCLMSSVAVIVNKKFLGGEKELKELMESKFTYNLCLDYYKESIAEFAKFITGSGVRATSEYVSIIERLF